MCMPSLVLKDSTAKKALQAAEEVSEVNFDGWFLGGDGVAGNFFEAMSGVGKGASASCLEHPDVWRANRCEFVQPLEHFRGRGMG